MKVLVTGRAIPQQPDRCTGQQLAEGFRQAGHDGVFCGNFYGEFHRWLGFEEATQKAFDLVVVTEMNDGGPAYTHLFDHIGLEAPQNVVGQLNMPGVDETSDGIDE